MQRKFDSKRNFDKKKSYNDNNNSKSYDKPREIKVPTPCNVLVNLFKFTGKMPILHTYNIVFIPEITSTKKVFEVFMKAAEKQGLSSGYAYDGLYSLVSLKKFTNWKCELQLGRISQNISVEFLRTVHMSEYSSETIAALENILKFDQRRRGYFVNRRTIVDGKSKPILSIDRQGLEIVAGLNGTMKYFGGNYYVNLDMTYLLFYQRRSLIDLAHVIYRSLMGRDAKSTLPRCNDEFWRRFESVIRGLRVATIHRPFRQTFSTTGLMMKKATELDFEYEKGVITVAAYFAKVYAPLKHPELPILYIRRSKGNTLIPLEVLEVDTAQRFRAQLNEEITTAMISAAAKRPDVRFQQINERARELAMLNNNTLREFGMIFDGRMHSCNGLILPPPQIAYGGDKIVHVINGGWNLRDVKARRGVSIQQWKVFVFARGRDARQRENEMKEMVRDPTMLRIANAYGIKFSSNVTVQVISSIDDYIKAIKAPFNLVILADKSAQCYELVKMHSETVFGVITQCVLAKNICKLKVPAFLSNLLLKINTKLGGHNWKLTAPLFADKNTCLIGIDVNHPGVGDLESPSIACVVGSVDYDFGNYHTVLLQQNRSHEIVDALKDAIRQILIAHYGNTKKKPQRLIIFRDGVGDSMFDSVFATEVAALRKCCKELEASYSPELNFIIAQKRHTIRFSSNGQNLIPGTVVDGLQNIATQLNSDTLVSAQVPIFDFYLSSHNAIQGTARSVRYITILNGSKFNAIDLQTSIYHLCHLYMRATKSVSIVPPIYYAHLGATRGTCYLKKNKDGAINMQGIVKNLNKNLYYL